MVYILAKSTLVLGLRRENLDWPLAPAEDCNIAAHKLTLRLRCNPNSRLNASEEIIYGLISKTCIHGCKFFSAVKVHNSPGSYSHRRYPRGAVTYLSFILWCVSKILNLSLSLYLCDRTPLVVRSIQLRYAMNCSISPVCASVVLPEKLLT